MSNFVLDIILLCFLFVFLVLLIVNMTVYLLDRSRQLRREEYSDLTDRKL